MARLDPNGLSKLWELIKKRTPVITQTTGGSERAVMSQKAVTEAIKTAYADASSIPDYWMDELDTKANTIQ
jgi:hypothetical protein